MPCLLPGSGADAGASVKMQEAAILQLPPTAAAEVSTAAALGLNQQCGQHPARPGPNFMQKSTTTWTNLYGKLIWSH